MHVHNLQYSIINSTKERILKDCALSFPTIYCKSYMYMASPFIKFYNIIIIIIINYYSGVSISTDDQRNVSATLLVVVGYFFLERRSK